MKHKRERMGKIPLVGTNPIAKIDRIVLKKTRPNLIIN
jgi:hypothetical protein